MDHVEQGAPHRRQGVMSTTLTFLVGILMELYVLGFMQDFKTWILLALSIVFVTAGFVMLLRREC
jgi:hypothetical protein